MTGFASRLLAEAVRVHEESRGAPLHEPAADQRACAAAGDLENRIIERACGLSVAPALRTALAHLRSGTQVAFAAALVGALVAGAGTTRLVLGAYGDGPVNFFLALISLLGLHTLMLLVWLIIVVFQPGGAAAGLLGSLVLQLGRRVTRWLHRGPLELAALRASGEVLAGPPLGRWVLGVISHSLWLAYLLGCLGALLLLLGTRQYDFAWETTILSERAYVAIARLIAAPVDALGFSVPDPEQVAASRRTGQGQLFTGRASWGELLVGCVVVYGLAPRGLALAATGIALVRARARYRLDLTKPGFARLQGRLMTFARPVGVVDKAEPSPAEEKRAVAAAAIIDGQGPVGILGLEIEPPKGGWPPAVAGIDWWDLGFAEDRGDRHRVVEHMAAADPPPKAIAIVCSLAATPDRGTGAFLESVVKASPTPVVVLATHGQRLRERSPLTEVEQRITDWRQLAMHAGIAPDDVIDVDLDHLTAESRRRLKRLLGANGEGVAPATRHLGQAFDLICEHASRWRSGPDAASRAELHRAIARLWDAEGAGSGWRDLLRIRSVDLTKPAEGLSAAADRMIGLLPVRLRLDPRWLAAGAASGALACVAAAVLVAPVAIASLPAWAGVGAALSALLPGRDTRKADAAETSAARPDFAPAVDAAALFAMLLELQGRDETTISRVLDAAVGRDEESHPLSDPAAVRARLDGLQARFDAALVTEQGRA
jgi:hypothetical protein